MWFQKISIPLPWKVIGNSGWWGSRGANSQRVWGVRRVIYFQRVQEHCLRETYQYRIYDLIKQQIDELQHILVYTQVQFAHLVDISERTFRDNDLFLRSMNEHVLELSFRYYFCFVKAGSSQRRLSFQITG